MPVESGAAPSGLRGVGDLGRQALARDLGAGRDDDGALDDVLQLAHVPRPRVLLEQRQHLGRELVGDVAAVLLVVLAYEVLCEREHVLAPLAQRGQLDGDDREAVVEVFAEGALPDGLLEVDVGGGDDAHVHLARRACRRAA